MISNTLAYPPLTLPLELRIRFLWNRFVRFAALSNAEAANSTYAFEREFKELIALESATIPQRALALEETDEHSASLLHSFSSCGT